jgi:hypothetical protein
MLENILILVVGILLGVLLMQTRLRTPIETATSSLWKSKTTKIDTAAKDKG